MAVCCYAEGIALCFLLFTTSVTTQDDYVLDNYQIEKENPPELNDFIQNVLNHKDDFRWIEQNAGRWDLHDVGRYEKDIESKIRLNKISGGSADDVNYEDYDEENEDGLDYESVRRSYRRIPGGYRERKRRRNRFQHRNRHKRGVDSNFNYDYDLNSDKVHVFPQSEYGVLGVPANRYGTSRRKFRRYLEKDAVQTPFFSPDSDEGAIVIDDTAPSTSHDILGLKKYRERNRKKIANNKAFSKRSVYSIDDFNSLDSSNALSVLGIQDRAAPKSPVSNNTGPYANIINTASLGIDLKSYMQNANAITNGNGNNTEGGAVGENGANDKDCSVKTPITSQFEGLRYPSINDVLANMSYHKPELNTCEPEPSTTEKSTVSTGCEPTECPTSSSSTEPPTTPHVNCLEDVSHPTSAIEQRILGANEDNGCDTTSSTPPSTSSTLCHTVERRDDEDMDMKNVARNMYRMKTMKYNRLHENRKSPKQIRAQHMQKIFYDINGNDEEYPDDEPYGFEGRFEEDYPENKREQPVVSEPPPFYLKLKTPFHSRNLLESADYKDDDGSSAKKRGLPELLGMNNEQDYKDDDIYGKQLLRKTNSEGDDEDGGGDPFVGKKLKYEQKKKDSEPFGSKGLHVVGIAENDAGQPEKMPTKHKEAEHPALVDGRVKKKAEQRSLNVCGTGKNRIYCDMNEEMDDGSNMTQSTEQSFETEQPYLAQGQEYQQQNPNQQNPNQQNKVEYYLQRVPVPQPTDDKPVKIVHISEVVNPPPKGNNEYPTKHYEKNEQDRNEMRDNSEQFPIKNSRHRKVYVAPRQLQEETADTPADIREESNQDIIDAGFKRKLSHTDNPLKDRAKRKNTNYLNKLRLNNYVRNNYMQLHAHKQPQFLFNNYPHNYPHQPKTTFDLTQPNFDNTIPQNVYVRKTRSFDPHKSDYPLQKQRRQERLPEAVTSAPRQNRNATEAPTEPYPPVSAKGPQMEYIEYQKEGPKQTTSDLNTVVAAAIVDQIMEAINSNSDLGASLGRGICKQAERQKNIEELTMIDKNSTKSDLRDTQSLLESLMTAINKIIEEKAKARLCRPLPPPLQSYLKTIIKIPNNRGRGGSEASSENLPLPEIKTREAVDDHPDAEQADFLFYKGDNETPEIKQRKIKYKMKMIRSLLDEYQQMSSKCKIKMRFVRDYLEKNLMILETLCEKCSAEEPAHHDNVSFEEKPEGSEEPKVIKRKHTTHPKGSRKHGENSNESDAVHDQLKKIGWDERKGKPLADFEVDKIVRESLGKEKRAAQAGSEQYKRLVEAVEKQRERLEKEEKLGKLFGQKRSIINEKYDTIKSSNKEMQDLGINFEEPLVFSTDN